MDVIVVSTGEIEPDSIVEDNGLEHGLENTAKPVVTVSSGANMVHWDEIKRLILNCPDLTDDARTEIVRIGDGVEKTD